MIAEDKTQDLSRLFSAQEATRRRRAEREAASANLELALIDERAATIMSTAWPVSQLPIDREALRHVLRYLGHGDSARLERDLKAHGYLREEGEQCSGPED